MRSLFDGFDEWFQGFGVAVEVVGDDEAARGDAIFEVLEVVEVFGFCSVEEGHVKFFRLFGDCFGGMAEDEGDIGEAGFGDVALG